MSAALGRLPGLKLVFVEFGGKLLAHVTRARVLVETHLKDKSLPIGRQAQMIRWGGFHPGPILAGKGVAAFVLGKIAATARCCGVLLGSGGYRCLFAWRVSRVGLGFLDVCGRAGASVFHPGLGELVVPGKVVSHDLKLLMRLLVARAQVAKSGEAAAHTVVVWPILEILSVYGPNVLNHLLRLHIVRFLGSGWQVMGDMAVRVGQQQRYPGAPILGIAAGAAECKHFLRGAEPLRFDVIHHDPAGFKVIAIGLHGAFEPLLHFRPSELQCSRDRNHQRSGLPVIGIDGPGLGQCLSSHTYPFAIQFPTPLRNRVRGSNAACFPRIVDEHATC